MFFWSFPSKAVQQKKNALTDLQAAAAAEAEKEKALKAQLTAARAGRQQTKERKIKLEQLQTLKQRKRAAEEEGKQFEQCDPERIKKLSQTSTASSIAPSPTPRPVGAAIRCCSAHPASLLPCVALMAVRLLQRQRLWCARTAPTVGQRTVSCSEHTSAREDTT